MKIENYTADTLLLAGVVCPSLPKALDTQCTIASPAPRWKTEFRILGDKNASKRFIGADPTARAIYNAKDALQTDMLDDSLTQRLSEVHNGAALYGSYMRLNNIAIGMRRTGVKVVKENLHFQRSLLRRRMRDAKNELGHVAEKYDCLTKNSEGRWCFNPNAPEQVKKLFVEKFGVVPTRYSETTGAPSFDETALLTVCRSPELEIRRTAGLVLKFRKWQKLLKSYITNLPIAKDGKVHPCWNVSGAKTGRWSANDPAFQTIPNPEYRERKNGEKYLYAPGLRDLFGADEGFEMGERDFSQFEAWTIALMSGDKNLIEDLKTGDVHRATAMALWKLDMQGWLAISEELRYTRRQIAKVAGYQHRYGSDPVNAHAKLVPSFPDLSVGQVIRLWLVMDKRYADVKLWQNSMVGYARKHGHVECPVDGRRYQFWGEIEPSACYNAPNQMSVAAKTNETIERVNSRLRPEKEDRILGQIHDSLLFESKDLDGLDKIVQEECERPIRFGNIVESIPTDGKFGTVWGSLKKRKA